MAVNRFVVLEVEYSPSDHSIGLAKPIAVMDTREEATQVLGVRALQSMDAGSAVLYCIGELPLEMSKC